MSRNAGYAAPRKERFVSTKRMMNDEEGMGRILKHSGMFIVLIVWNVAEAFTRFIPSAIWVFIISGLLDALINCLVIIFAAKLKGRNAWIWAAIISGWNVISLLSHMLPINLWILIDIILDVIINILFLIFAPMLLLDKGIIPAASVGAAPDALTRKPVSGKDIPVISSGARSAPVPASRPDSGAQTKTTPETASGAGIITDSVSKNPLEKDAIKIAANLSETNRILAEQLQKQGGNMNNDGLVSEKGGEENAGQSGR